MKRRLEGISVLSVVSPEEFNDDEYALPRRILEEEGALVRTASTRPGPAKGMFGSVVEPELVLDQVDPGQFQAITIAGGSGSPHHLWKNAPLVGLVRQFNEAGKVVAAICLSPVVLAEAGLLDGLTATVYRSPKAIERLVSLGAVCQDEEVVRNGRILTGRDPQAAKAYGETLVRTIWEEILGQESAASFREVA
jgi:protease I